MQKLEGEAWLVSRQKRIEDWAFTLGVLPFAAPPAAIGALAVRLIDKADPIFHQDRVGQYDQLFEITKIRSMPDHANFTPSASNPDKRVSQIGHVLRKLRLDEFPQVMNVWRGDMSVVGPRAIVPADYEIAREVLGESTYQEWRQARRLARTGIFDEYGVRYHGGYIPDDTAIKARAEIDMDYIEHASRQRDHEILAATFELFGKVATSFLGTES